MITPELRELLLKGPPSISIRDDNCCEALDHFSAILQSLLLSMDDIVSPLEKAASRWSPSNGSPYASDRR
jgi:hypothetical protein